MVFVEMVAVLMVVTSIVVMIEDGNCDDGCGGENGEYYDV